MRSKRSSKKPSGASSPKNGCRNGPLACPSSTACAAPSTTAKWNRREGSGGRNSGNRERITNRHEFTRICTNEEIRNLDFFWIRDDSCEFVQIRDPPDLMNISTDRIRADIDAIAAFT